LKLEGKFGDLKFKHHNVAQHDVGVPPLEAVTGGWNESGWLELFDRSGDQSNQGNEHEELLHEPKDTAQNRGGYPKGWRCPGTWWAPPPSKRLGRVNLVRRVRFPSTSA